MAKNTSGAPVKRASGKSVNKVNTTVSKSQKPPVASTKKQPIPTQTKRVEVKDPATSNKPKTPAAGHGSNTVAMSVVRNLRDKWGSDIAKIDDATLDKLHKDFAISQAFAEGGDDAFKSFLETLGVLSTVQSAVMVPIEFDAVAVIGLDKLDKFREIASKFHPDIESLTEEVISDVLLRDAIDAYEIGRELISQPWTWEAFFKIMDAALIIGDNDEANPSEEDELDDDLDDDVESVDEEITETPSDEEVEAIVDEAEALVEAAHSEDGVKTVAAGTGYVHERDADEGEDDATDEEIIATMIDANDDVPDMDYMMEYFTSHELDVKKRDRFMQYINSLDDRGRKALWESFKASYGSNIATIDALTQTSNLIKSVEASKSLSMRNAAAQSELSRMGSVMQQVARALRIEASDIPLGTMRVENITKTIAEQNRNLTILNSAIIEMAQMLMLGDVSGEAPDMAINIERAVKLCSIIGYSAKGWAKVYDHATGERSVLTNEIESLKASLKTINESLASTQALYAQEQKRVESMILKAQTFTIRNHSGFFLTTVNPRTTDNEEYFRVSPFNIRLTTNEDEALTFDDLDDARAVFDGLAVWAKKSIMVRKMFKNEGVDAATLFIAAVSMVRVD